MSGFRRPPSPGRLDGWKPLIDAPYIDTHYAPLLLHQSVFRDFISPFSLCLRGVGMLHVECLVSRM